MTGVVTGLGTEPLVIAIEPEMSRLHRITQTHLQNVTQNALPQQSRLHREEHFDATIQPGCGASNPHSSGECRLLDRWPIGLAR